ncbi:MAG TPA: extracellular solute-binding protein [Dongiaceae bacterium]|jgi:microcin C transport system substrate-binding protein|nr:extracellular solute-binding protein [Dongiaceae bacterium]
MRGAVIFAVALLYLAVALGHASAQQKVHAVTLMDQPKYGPDAPYPDYVNPEAPKGGTVHYGVVGTSFDTFNPFAVRGTPAAGSSSLYETLTGEFEDDPSTAYGLIAKDMELAPDKSWIIFNLRPEARWQDGQAITAEDVVFSFDLLKSKGAPLYRLYYANVVKAEALEPRRVKFTFANGGNRELPSITGQLPVLAKHYWQNHNFEEPSLNVPLGSGPYRVKDFEPGRSVTLGRVKDYWGANLPLRRGQNNYDVIRYDYYRDPTIALEAFKAGAYDIRSEASAKEWATAYNVPAVRAGRIKKELIPDANPQGLQAFIFNIRRPLFADRRVREALGYAFDFEWSNKTLFYGQYKRSRSFFGDSELAATGIPEGEERAILEKYRAHLPEEVFTTEYRPPVSDGSGDNRANLAMADKLLAQAGWTIQNGKRMKDGQEFAFEFLLDNPTFERIVLPFAQNLKRLGITLRLRTVDDAQYQQRLENFDYDMISGGFAQSISPGNEQRDFWGSKAADEKGSANTVGIKNPVIDDLVEELVRASDRKHLLLYCHALDRVLQWNYYVIPNWHLAATRIAYWDKFGRPSVIPKYGTGLNTWWIDPAKQANLVQAAAPQPAGNPPAEGTASQPPQPAPATAPAQAPAASRGSSPIPGILLVLVIGLGTLWILRRRRK